jgi:hypothetical protein
MGASSHCIEQKEGRNKGKIQSKKYILRINPLFVWQTISATLFQSVTKKSITMNCHICNTNNNQTACNHYEKALTTIKPNTTIKAVSICDSNCVFKAEVLERKGNFVTLQMDGQTFRKKVNKDFNGNEYVMALGTYSMAPAFR